MAAYDYTSANYWRPPKDFRQFYKRYPRYVRTWVARHFRYSVTKQADLGHTTFNEMLADYEQDLLLHLAALPATSKYRKLGYTDPIQLFMGHDASDFRKYVNMLLSRRIGTIRTHEKQDALFVAESAEKEEMDQPIYQPDIRLPLCESYLQRKAPMDVPVFRKALLGHSPDPVEWARMRTHLKQIFAGEEIRPRRPYKKRTSKVLL